jgi:hypothetical protein
MEVNNDEISIDFYVNYKNKLQESLNKLEQSKLIELFHIIQAELPNVQYSKNKNGYFIDIKQLPVSLIETLDSKCDEFFQSDEITLLHDK